MGLEPSFSRNTPAWPFAGNGLLPLEPSDPALAIPPGAFQLSPRDMRDPGSIAGIDPATGQRVIDQMPDIRGCDVHIGFTTLDQYYQPMSAIVPIWLGTASHVTDAMEPVTGTSGRSMNLSMAVLSGNGTRSRPSLSMWSSSHQKALYPTDKFCDDTARLARGVAPAWPNY